MNSKIAVFNIIALIFVACVIVALFYEADSETDTTPGGEDTPGEDVIPPEPPSPPTPPAPPAPTTYFINANGGKTVDNEDSLEISASEALSSTISAKFDFPTKQTVYWTENADGTGTKYVEGDSVPAGTTIYCKWCLKLVGIDAGSFTLDNFRLIDADDPSAPPKELSEGMWVYDSCALTVTGYTFVGFSPYDDDCCTIDIGSGVQKDINLVNATFDSTNSDTASSTIKLVLIVEEGFEISITDVL